MQAAATRIFSLASPAVQELCQPTLQLHTLLPAQQNAMDIEYNDPGVPVRVEGLCLLACQAGPFGDGVCGRVRLRSNLPHATQLLSALAQARHVRGGGMGDRQGLIKRGLQAVCVPYEGKPSIAQCLGTYDASLFHLYPLSAFGLSGAVPLFCVACAQVASPGPCVLIPRAQGILLADAPFFVHGLCR